MPPIKAPQKHPRPAQLPRMERKDELQEPWERFVTRADFLLGGWDNVRGVTPDDLAQEALRSYCEHLESDYAEDAHKVASTGLQRDVTNLFAKTDREDYGQDALVHESDDPEDEDWEVDITDADPQSKHFDPDSVDLLADILTPRQLTVILGLFEYGFTIPGLAEQLGVSHQAVSKIRAKALVILESIPHMGDLLKA